MPCPMVPAPSTAIFSTATEVRLPFLETGFQPFLRIVALEQTLLQLALQRETFGKSGLEARLNGALDVSDGLRRLVGRGELPGVIVDGVGKGTAAQFGITPDVIDKPHRAGVLEREERACRHQLDRPGLADQARKALRSAGAGPHAEGG